MTSSASSGHSLASIEDIDEVVAAAGVLAFRVARARGFVEGSKRTLAVGAAISADRRHEELAELEAGCRNLLSGVDDAVSSTGATKFR